MAGAVHGHGDEGAEEVGHIVCALILAHRTLAAVVPVGGHEQVESYLLQGALAAAGCVRGIGCGLRQFIVHFGEGWPQRSAERFAQRIAGEMDRVRIDICPNLPGQISLAGQRQRLRGEGRIGAPILDKQTRCVAIAAGIRGFAASAQGGHGTQHKAGGVGLRSLPTIKGVYVVGQ